MGSCFAGIKGILCDLDGVLYVGDRPIDGACRAIEAVKHRGLPIRFVTNTTTKSLATLHEKIRDMGLPVEQRELITAAQAGVMYLKKKAVRRCFFVLEDDVRADYRSFEVDETHPDTVVIGDLGDAWNFDLMNRIFRLVMNGADILALHKGKFFQVQDGLALDTGAFVAGLEYATGKKAAVVGKPEASFFQAALDDMGVAPEDAVMIGDDLASDVGGAQKAGLRGCLVRTGKFREEQLTQVPVTPDHILDSIADLVAQLE